MGTMDIIVNGQSNKRTKEKNGLARLCWAAQDLLSEKTSTACALILSATPRTMIDPNVVAAMLTAAFKSILMIAQDGWRI